MYLAGQLPLGPDSANKYPPALNPQAISSLEQKTYLVPEGGDLIVSPTLATADGIVQTPVQTPTGRCSQLKLNSASYADCGDYGADGSLSTIRNRAGRGMGAMCQSGYQVPVVNRVQSASALLALGAGLALVAVVSSGGRR